MKAIIENHLHYTQIWAEKLEEFNFLLILIYESKNENDLVDKISFSKMKYFIYGFGSSHMWVHEKGSKERLLIVEF